MSTLETYRDEIRRRSPPWLQRGVAERFMYAIGLHVDVFGDSLVAGLRHRFPGAYSFESLSLLGRERRLSRGRVESDATYAARLLRWLTDHQVRGGPYALLAQLYYYFRPAVFTIDLIYHSGRRFRLNADVLIAGAPLAQAVERDDLTWFPDAAPTRWAQWWLFYLTDQWAVTPPTDQELEDLRLVPRAWNAAHCIGHIVLFPSTAELWDYPTDHTWDEAGTWDTTGEPRFLTVDADADV